MDFVRFTGEWFIYYVLIALGGGVLIGLTGGDPRADRASTSNQVAGGCCRRARRARVVVAAWLVEAKQRVIENMAPVLTMVFTPLFALMLRAPPSSTPRPGSATPFDRELLSVFDALLSSCSGSCCTRCRRGIRDARRAGWTASSWSPSSARSCST